MTKTTRPSRSWLTISLVLTMALSAGCGPVLEALGEGPTSVPAPTLTWPALPSPTATLPASPLPVYATVEPTATEMVVEPSPTIRPTALPTVVPTPTPETGYYGDELTGFGFSYPSGLEPQETGDGVMLVNADPFLLVIAGSELLDEDESEEEGAGELFGIFGSGEITRPVTVTTTTLVGGDEALLMQFEEPAEDVYARYVSLRRGRRAFFIVAAGPAETFQVYPRTIEAMQASMRLQEPRPYGISREHAMFLAGSQPHTLDPARTLSGAQSVVGRIFSGLVTLDENLQVVPDLAERWEVSEDGTVYTFYLRPEVTFHDGKPVTAGDFKYSWERATDPELEFETAETYLTDIVGVRDKLEGEADEIEGVTVIDDHTLRVTIDAPKVYFLAKLTYPVSFVLDEENLADEDWEHHPNGTGPFSLHTWEDDRLIILQRYEHFYLEPPQLEHIVIAMYATVPMWGYENDEIDMVGVGSYNVERVTDPSDPLNAELTVMPDLCTSRLILDVTVPPFDDPLVRQAFAHAVDRQHLAEVVLKGTDVPAYSILPPGMPGYSEETDGLHFDPDLAQQLLADSEYGSAEGLPEIVMTTSGYGGELDDYESALVEMWRTHVGVEVTVEQLEPTSYFYELRENHGQIISLGWCADYPDPENFLDLLYHTGTPENLGGYSNTEVDALLEQARSEADLETRMALYHQAEQMIIDDVPDILLDHGRTYLLVKPYVHNLTLTPMGILANTWRVISIERESE
jgi:oligopeptide transport system substrate-binding protein